MVFTPTTNKELVDAVMVWVNNSRWSISRHNLGKISEWDTSNITDMSNLFYRTSFNDDISQWNVSNVTNMDNMFNVAPKFNQPIGDWNVSKVTSMVDMFRSAINFNQPIGGWNVSNVIDMHGMLANVKAFNQPIGGWKVQNVINMGTMFAGTEVFNQHIGDWNVSNVINMGSMFQYAKAFNQPIDDWNVSNVTSMYAMFANTEAFDQAIGNWNVSNVANMYGMFANAKAFNQPISNWNVSNVANMGVMFAGTEAFNQPIGDWNVSAIVNMSDMFQSAKAFNQPIGDWNVSNYTDLEVQITPSNKKYKNTSNLIEDNNGLSFITIPKGTVLFRKSKDINSDYCGYPDGTKPNHYNAPPDTNVFFYFYPFYSDTVECANRGTNKMFTLTQDVKLLNLTYPSTINRESVTNSTEHDNIAVSCDQKSDFGHRYDPCISDDLLRRYPDVMGILDIARFNAEQHVLIYYNKKLPSVYSVLWEDSMMKGSPEIILYPFQERFMTEIHHSIEECEKIPKNYELLTECAPDNSIVSQLNDFLRPEGKHKKHITIFTPLKLFVVYEELDDKYKKDCVPLIMDIKSKLQVFQTDDLYTDDMVPFHKREITENINNTIIESLRPK